MTAQGIAMRASWPGFKLEYCRCNRAVWTGKISPSSLSGEYLVELSYKVGGAPKVSILSPALRPREDGEDIPHVYPGNILCLYLPKAREWNPSMRLSDTIVPWAALWLYYYEVWHSTGVWAGGGEHPVGKKSAPLEA